MLSVRIAFNKVGALKFISHLDLNRTVKKIFIRAELPILYSEGFNPRPKIVFASTLSLGVESYAEFADIRLNADLSLEEIKERLKAHSHNLEITDVYIPKTDFKEIDKTKYDLYFETDADPEKIKEEFRHTFKVEKTRNKKSKNPITEEIDILPSISDLAISAESNHIKITLALPTNSQNYLNPELIAMRLKSIFPISDYHFTKTLLLTPTGEAFR